MRSLIVEDSPTCRSILHEMLAPWGTCDVVGNGEDALAVYRLSIKNQWEPYKLICLDIFMPKMNGQDTLLAIRALEESLNVPPVRVLVTTGGNFTDEKIEFLSLKCDGYMEKPIRGDKLLHFLQEFGLV